MIHATNHDNDEQSISTKIAEMYVEIIEQAVNFFKIIKEVGTLLYESTKKMFSDFYKAIEKFGKKIADYLENLDSNQNKSLKEVLLKEGDKIMKILLDVEKYKKNLLNGLDDPYVEKQIAQFTAKIIPPKITLLIKDIGQNIETGFKSLSNRVKDIISPSRIFSR